MNRTRNNSGFTIVELLIVVVVIAILAAIAIVSYNGVTQRAVESGMQQELRSGASRLEVDKVQSGTETYPTSVASANGGQGIRVSGTSSLQYTTSGSGASSVFCLSISSTRTSSTYHFSSANGGVKPGYCPGHSGAIVATLAGSTQGFNDATGAAAQFNRPADIAIDASGNVYVSDTLNNRIRRITPAGVVTTFAGSGTAGFADGTGVAAQFNQPTGIDIDSAGNLYVADWQNHRIRRITPAAVVTTLAGSGTAGFADATGTAAQFNSPYGIATNGAGTLIYVADANNHRIRAITSAGVVTTLAGSGAQSFANGTGAAAQFNWPHGIDLDSSGNVYVADNGNHRIRRVTPAGVTTTFSGNGAEGYLDGLAATARFAWPEAVAVTSSGTVYVADAYNYMVRSVTSAGDVSTVAGQAAPPQFADGIGASARFNYPWGIEVNSAGVVYVADTWNYRIRTIQIP